MSYPDREPFFGHRVIRMMAKACAAQEIGTDGFALVAVVAMTEDSARYKRAVTYWNGQLMPILGFSQGQLNRARRKACEAGWLNYEAGTKGRAGKYWTSIPEHAREYADTPLDDGDVFLSTSEQESARNPVGIVEPNQDSYSPVHSEALGKRKESDGNPMGKCTPFLPIPIPNPIPFKESARAKSADAVLPAGLVSLVEQWNALDEGIAPRCRNPGSAAILKGWQAAHKNPDLREYLAHPEAIVEAIRGSPFCHGKSWFRLPWLFAKGSDRREWNLEKLMDGAYRQRNASEDLTSF